MCPHVTFASKCALPKLITSQNCTKGPSCLTFTVESAETRTRYATLSDTEHVEYYLIQVTLPTAQQFITTQLTITFKSFNKTCTSGKFAPFSGLPVPVTWSECFQWTKLNLSTQRHCTLTKKKIETLDSVNSTTVSGCAQLNSST